MARIAVINDSSEFLGVMSDLISAMGHDMTGFHAERTTVKAIVASRPDVIVLDLILDDRGQELSGWELLVLTRAHPQLSTVPLVLCTGATWEVEQRADELAQIADVHLLAKPFAVEDMVGLIRTLLPSERSVS